jgi:AraC-like DNA-binding protein
MRSARFSRPDDLGGIDVFRATLSSFGFRPHAHEEFFIAITESGIATPRYRGGQHVIGPGELIVLNPEEAHAGGPPPDRQWRYRSLYPGQDMMRSIMAEFPPGARLLPRFHGDAVRDPAVAVRLLRFCQLSEQPGSSQLERETLLTQGLVLLAARHAASPASSASPGEPVPAGHEPRAIRIARDYLDEHAAQNVPLRALSAHAGLSPFHLCRVFAAATGMTPHAYQSHLRVRRARTLLTTGLPISEAATAAGFYDQAHLTRHFTRITGLTPGEFARMAGPSH